MKTTGEIKDLLQKKELDSTLLDIYLDESRLDYQRQIIFFTHHHSFSLVGENKILILSSDSYHRIYAEITLFNDVIRVFFYIFRKILPCN